MKSYYAARIANATPAQLVAITYELTLDYIDDALKAAANLAVFEQNIKKAMDCVENLMDALDMSYDISEHLLELYVYVDRQLVDAKLTGKPEPLLNAKKVFESMLEAWNFAAKEVGGGEAAMENSEQVYAGLTYEKGELSEFIDEKTNRGYRV